MAATEPLLKTQVAYSIAIPVGMLIVDNVEDRAVLGRLTGMGLNIAYLPHESFQQLQDSAIIELYTREGRTK